MPSPSTTLSEVDVGAVEDFPLGKITAANLSGRGILIVRNRDGVFALRNICPHQGAMLSRGTLTGELNYCGTGRIELANFGSVLKCPWHGWDYSLASGQAVGGNRNARVRSYRAREADGRIMVDPG